MTSPPLKSGIYGHPDTDLVSIPDGARQCSPLIPESADIAECPDASLDYFAIAAPAGTQERQFVMAHALRALKPDGELHVVAGKKKGGLRLKSELDALGCSPIEIISRKHQKLAIVAPPKDPAFTLTCIAETGPRLDNEMQIWTQPGIFSWNRPDTGTLLLIDNLPQLEGRGADLGCGLGLLSHAALQSEAITSLVLIDIDRRAIEMAYRNVGDDRASFKWHDLRQAITDISELDFIIMNPPFHDSGIEDHGLGKAFVRTASKLLRKGGVAWIVANRHLPYEHELKDHFRSFEQLADSHGFKVIHAVK